MIRWLLVAALVASSWPQQAQAQLCRRVCKPGEVRDANRCCVRPSVLRRRPSGSLRFEADVKKLRLRVGRRWFRRRVPAVVRGLPVGTHAVVARAGSKTWRGRVTIRRGHVSRLFASMAGGEWAMRRGDRRRARAILDRALRAKGGSARLAKLRSLHYTGRSTDNRTGHTIVYQKPGRLRWDRTSHIEVTTSVSRWVLRRAGHALKTTLPDQTDLARLWLWPDLVLLRHREPGTRVALLPRAHVDGMGVDVVQLARKDGSARVRLYLHRATHMLVRYERIDSRGRFAPAVVLGDYRRLGPYRFAYRWTYRGHTIDWTRIEVDQRISAGTFSPPKATKPQVRVVERLEFQSRQPQLAHVNTDGVIDVLGWCHYTRTELYPNGKRGWWDGFFLCAVGGRRHTLLWRLGPYKQPASLAVLTGRRLALSHRLPDGRFVIDVHSLASKRRLSRFFVRDRVNAMCMKRNRTELYARLKSGMYYRIGLRKLVGGYLSVSGGCRWYPAKCPRAARAARCVAFTAYFAHLKASRPGNPLRWFLHSYGLRTPSRYVVFGYSYPGTPFPRVVVFDSRGKLKWTRRILPDRLKDKVPVAADVVGNLIVIAYRARNGGKLVALSLHTGKRRWQAALPFNKVGQLLATRSRIYVTAARRTKLAVVSTKTGRSLGNFGHLAKKSTRPARANER